VSSLPEVLDEKLGCEVVIHDEYPGFGMTAEYLSALRHAWQQSGGVLPIDAKRRLFTVFRNGDVEEESLTTTRCARDVTGDPHDHLLAGAP
jgi:hypothetical protein